ncbi:MULTISPECIES: hypothetical protein [unclassified Streptomyces]|uniref:hypothetical protein n=1 Tax=unclassified Streptomyces TaxID=2593676 RepID=UPI002E79D768|nr:MULTISPECIES: hypothetical protein [unclassified Streptomyces]MEE1759013.1 hypothetical protein [Streptomyces sp. SP18BB07]MEE1833934.1 hypothetical protein [Streptomyces sp. SP17KL33]
MLVSSASVVVVPASSVSATDADCDGIAVVGVFRTVESGASFTFHGRGVEPQNKSALDRCSRAEFKSGRRPGDRLWVDRSHRSFPDFKSGVTKCGKWYVD